MRKRIAVLGSTGSIGRQTLEVISWHPERMEVVALAAGSDSPTFRQQVAALRPRVAAVGRLTGDPWPYPSTELLNGEEGLCAIASDPQVDVVVMATSGKTGLRPTLAALGAGKTVALANKEALVMAGHLVTQVADAKGAPLLPVDSEHSAIWQCLLGENGARGTDRLRRLVLTASGGAVRDLPVSELAQVTPAQALQHPTWKMGPKITVDSATLMNKGLEILEATWLFRLPVDRIEVVLHRESIVHCLVEFVDGSCKAQMSLPDMRIPIQYALTYPERLPAPVPSLDLARLGTLSFSELDEEKYPCPRLAREAGRLGGTYPSVLNGANEEAVHLFLQGHIRFDQIVPLIRAALDAHHPSSGQDLEEVLEADRWARQVCRRMAQATVA